MLDALDYWFARYPDTYTLDQFVAAFSPSNPRFALTVGVAALTFAIGFLEYIWSFRLVRAERSAPYPLYMHAYYFAIDFMGVIVFALAAVRTGGFWLFIAASVAEVVWVCFEVYNLVKCVTVEREGIFGHLYPDGVPVRAAVMRIAGAVLITWTCVNLFRVFMDDPAMFKWYIFTNIVMAIGPGLYWEKRGTRVGASWVLAWIILVGTVNSFLPTNMWALASPYFGFDNNPWFYLAGVVAIGFAVRNLIVLKRLPAKPQVCEQTGRKTIL